MVIHEEKTVTVDVVSCGKAIYEERLRDLLEIEENIGKYLVIDTDSGDYEMDTDRIEAVLRLSRHHSPAHSWHLKIGYTAIATIVGKIKWNVA